MQDGIPKWRTLHARTEPTVEEIIARYAEARGGMESLRAVTSLIIHSERREGDHLSADAVMALMRPYYKLVGNPDNLSLNFREGYDGGAWEFYGDFGVVLRVVSQASADYPMMASSAFALGRAYRTTGKFNAARREFRRALRLDPSYSRASNALREMESEGEERRIVDP